MIKKRYITILLLTLIIIFFATTFSAERIVENDSKNIGHGFGPQFNFSGYSNNQLILISTIGLIITMISAVFLERNVSRISSKTGKTVGTALMGISSSLPLLVIAITLAIEKRTDLIIINVVGANIANLTIVLGTLCLLKPIKRGKSFGRGFFAFLTILISTLIIFVNFNTNLGKKANFGLNVFDGYFLIILFFIFILILSFFKNTDSNHLKSKNLLFETLKVIFFGICVSWFANSTVKAFIIIAENYAVPAIIIGSIIGVVGASLPELAIGLVCLFKKEDEAIFSNLITSSIVNFNLGLGFAVLITKNIFLDEISLIVKIPFMIFVMFANILFFMPKKTGKNAEVGVTRTEGIILIFLFFVWMLILTFLS